MKRVFLIVLDSVGVGAAPDAADFGDVGAHTVRSVWQSGELRVPTLRSLGLGNLAGMEFLGPVSAPRGAYMKLREVSRGKDTTTGHWELAGLVCGQPFPTYPDGFPNDVIEAFTKATGYGVLCNRPYSGTDVIRDYGAEHLQTGKLIVYTSADSVFQIAAHEEKVPPETLYEICRKARALLRGEHGVARVIARPFIGNPASGFTRTPNRRDFSLPPPRETLCDTVKSAGLDSLSVGKIYDIFAGRGFTDHILTHGNAEGMAATDRYAATDFHGLCFVNLVDFDMLCGHRRDPVAYAHALNAFDGWLTSFLPKLGAGDVLLITADHGCDPSFRGTDHTRENVPLLIYGKGIRPVGLADRDSFADVAATVADLLGVPYAGAGESMAGELTGERT